MLFPFYAVIAKEPASPPLPEHPVSSRIRFPYQVGSFIFFLQSLCISLGSSFSSLELLFPIRPFVSLSCCHSIYFTLPFQTPSTFSTLAFSFFYCFSFEFVFLSSSLLWGDIHAHLFLSVYTAGPSDRNCSSHENSDRFEF